MSNKNMILGLIAVIAILVGLAWIAQPKTNTQTAANQNAAVINALTIPEKFYDFSSISMKDGKVSRVFKIKNDKAEPLVISKIYTSCMCTEASITLNGEKSGPFGMAGHGFIPKINKTINPGQEAEIEVVFDPNAHGPAGVGRISRNITIEGETGLLAELLISANVTP